MSAIARADRLHVSHNVTKVQNLTEKRKNSKN